jgi:hypothetical protein
MRQRRLINSYVNDNRAGAPGARLRPALLALLLLAAQAPAQAHPAVRADGGGIVPPFEELLRRPARLRPELQGKHPRVFFTAESLELLRARARTTHRELWRETSRRVRGVEEEPLPAGHAALDRAPAQYNAAYTLAELTFAYVVERDPRHLAAAKKWLKAVVSWEPWGYTYRTPNVDLPPAHLLYAVGFAYDSLYEQLDAGEREAVRRKLARQARLMYEYHKYKPRKRYAYSQNHSFIPMAGLAVAAFALMGEEPEAEEWARLARAVYDRVLLTFGTDGYYYEGFHYAAFSLHWVTRYLDALEHATGEDLYPRMRASFLPLKYYFAHSVMPDGVNVFDFGDTGKGAAERNAEKRERLNTGYEVLYRLAAKYRDAETQGVADWLRRDLRTQTWERHWAFFAFDPSVRAAPVASLPTSHHFQDHGTVFWRSGWDPAATAFAFRCGPPEGHHVTALLPRLPDWRLSTGHAHPDAGSFIIYANGRYLTGDTGYTGVKLTSDHNTVLVDGRGQANDGRHEVFKEVPYERLDRVRLAEVSATREYFYARGEAAAGYYPELGLKKFDRHFLHVAPDYFVVWDELAAEEPRQFSWLLNAEREIEKVGGRRFVLRSGDAALVVERLWPEKASGAVEPQMVTTQGRPGSVEKGEQEQRGFQLVESTEGKSREAEFLHFLSPSGAPPEVSALAGGARGARISWPGGDTEVVLLRGGAGAAEGLALEGARAVLRTTPAGGWRRLIVDAGLRLARGGKVYLRASRPVTVSLEASAGAAWRGGVEAREASRITVAAQGRPREVRVNGSPVKFEYDGAAGALTFGVGAGASRVEAR